MTVVRRKMILFFLIIHRLLDVEGKLLYCSSAVPNASYMIVRGPSERENEQRKDERLVFVESFFLAFTASYIRKMHDTFRLEEK